ncbi:TetR/AcrR family transcriptional regulator [Micromonospora sp. CA-111912]|uniref:TetR/AcrR family transcriptional regulator n=1 Tax=Micromonospora sp. CA-111912 TaxID=3239955 RepID=UPI003D8E9599
MSSLPRPVAEAVASAGRAPGRPAVPVGRIVATALQILDEGGADALSMRLLAQRLDSGTATLYRHFGNRAKMITKVVDHVFGEVELDAEMLAEMSWDQVCRSVAQRMFDVLSGHPKVASLLVEQMPMGPNAMMLRERCIAALLNSDFPPHLAARSYATLARYVLGFAIQLAGSTDQTDQASAPVLFQDLTPSQFPATLAVADTLPVLLKDEFTFGLELIISGLRQLRGDG